MTDAPLPGPAATPQPVADEAAAAAPVPQDVTHEFADLAPEDTIYRTHDGYLVKVKVVWDDESVSDESRAVFGSQHGREVFHVTGSIVGADGKALRRHNGDLAIHDLKHRGYHHAERLEDPNVGVERARLTCVAETVTAEKHYQMIRGGYVRGIASRTDQAARKAREAAAQPALDQKD